MQAEDRKIIETAFNLGVFAATAGGQPQVAEGISALQTVFNGLVPKNEKPIKLYIEEEINRAIEAVITAIKLNEQFKAASHINIAYTWFHNHYKAAWKGKGLHDKHLDKFRDELDISLGLNSPLLPQIELLSHSEYHDNGGVDVFCMGASIHLLFLKMKIQLDTLVDGSADETTYIDLADYGTKYIHVVNNHVARYDQELYPKLHPYRRYLMHADSLPEESDLAKILAKERWIYFRDYLQDIENIAPGEPVPWSGSPVNWGSSSIKLSLTGFLDQGLGDFNQHYTRDQRHRLLEVAMNWEESM